MADKIRLLLACSDPKSRAHLTDSLNDTEFETILASSCEESSGVLARQPVSMVFCEDWLPGGGFPKLLKDVKESGTSTPVVVLSRTGDWEEYLAALRLGAFDMVIPPYERVAIHTVAYNALHESRVSRGARDVEALPHKVPKSALRAAAHAAHAAYAGQGGALHGSPEYRSGREQAADSLPGAEKNGVGEESLSTGSSLKNPEGAVQSGDTPSDNQETDGSVSKKVGG
jgi:DNA-binding NarL/FixJ family response regulator